MQRRTVFAILALALVASACTGTRPVAPEFTESSTTTTTIPDGSKITTTTISLPPPEEQVRGTVQSVIDGDTLAMTIDGISVEVRLDGINAPEADECWGPEATSLLASRVTNQELVLVEGETDTDQFGRLLRYAYIESGGETEFLNSTLVEEGNALAVQNGGPHAESLKALEARAYQSGKGMWGTVVCGDEEALRADRPVVRVSEIQFDPTGPDDDALNEEYVTFVNEGYGRVSFAGWTVRDESSTNRLTFPNGTLLAPGESVTVVTGCEGGPADSIQWCSDTPVWSNGGDTVIVSDTHGNAVIWFTYPGNG
ncbi:MAG: lamin tail domain-containing protein [Acidimicrobiia bacterium]